MHQGSLNRGYFFAGIIIVIWTGFTLVSRLGVTGNLNAWDVAAIRMTTASVIALPLWLHLAHHRRIDWHIAALTLTGGLGYVLLVYSAFHLAPAAHGGILLSGIQPFVMAICAWAVMGEKPSRQRLAGIGVIALGAGMLGFSVLQGGGDSWRGDLMFVGASFCWSLYTVLARRWQVSPWESTLNVALLAAAVYLPVYWLVLPKQIALASMGEIALQAAYQGALAAIIQMVIYMRAVEILGASRMGMLTALTPIAAALAAVPVLHEPLTWTLLASLLLVSTGVVVGNAKPRPLWRASKCPT